MQEEHERLPACNSEAEKTQLHHYPGCTKHLKTKLLTFKQPKFLEPILSKDGIMCFTKKHSCIHSDSQEHIHTCQKTGEFPSQPMLTEQALPNHYMLGANCRNPQVYSDSVKCGKSDLHS